jgi:hypothetical protein
MPPEPRRPGVRPPIVYAENNLPSAVHYPGKLFAFPYDYGFGAAAVVLICQIGIVDIVL